MVAGRLTLPALSLVFLGGMRKRLPGTLKQPSRTTNQHVTDLKPNLDSARANAYVLKATGFLIFRVTDPGSLGSVDFEALQAGVVTSALPCVVVFLLL
jgi:hypothetical protein